MQRQSKAGEGCCSWRRSLASDKRDPVGNTRAYAELKELIQTGVLAPNTFLSERQLAQHLGMSKTPIRSALEHLEAQGLLAVSPQQGIVVKELSAHEIIDLFDMRLAIEPFVVSRLARRSLAPGPVACAEKNLAEQRSAARAGDAVLATRLDVEFHLLLAELLDNREMMAWLTRCFDKMHRSILRINTLAAGRLLKSYQDHATILEAALGAKGDLAAQAMIDHLRYGKHFLLGD
jgi:DNA-binding GntR family transcriptional regulator